MTRVARRIGAVALAFFLAGAGCTAHHRAIGNPSPTATQSASPTPTPSAPIPERIVSIAFVSPGRGWVLTTRRVLYTGDGGARWRGAPLVAAFEPIGGYNFPTGQFFVHGTTAWVATIGSVVRVRRYSNGGAVVSTSRVPSPPGGAIVSTSIDFLDDDTGWVSVTYATVTNSPANASELFRTSDGGRSWALVSRASPVVGNLHFVSRSDGWALQAPLLRTLDGGHTWRAQRVPVQFIQELPGTFDALSMFGSSGLVQARVPTGMQGYPVYAVTADGGATWTVRAPKDGAPVGLGYFNTGPPLNLSVIDATHWRVANVNSLVATDDAGRHWRVLSKKLPFGPNEGLSFVSLNSGWAFSVENCETGYCPTHLEETSDGGLTWHVVPTPAG